MKKFIINFASHIFSLIFSPEDFRLLSLWQSLLVILIIAFVVFFAIYIPVIT